MDQQQNKREGSPSSTSSWAREKGSCHGEVAVARWERPLPVPYSWDQRAAGCPLSSPAGVTVVLIATAVPLLEKQGENRRVFISPSSLSLSVQTRPQPQPAVTYGSLQLLGIALWFSDSPASKRSPRGASCRSRMALSHTALSVASSKPWASALLYSKRFTQLQ